jgi:hypothetical protein
VRFAVLIYEVPGADEGFTAEERQGFTREYLAVRDEPSFVSGGRLHPGQEATTLRLRDGEALVTDGPFASTKEVFGGFYVVEADGVEAVLEIARRLPAARLGGAIEIRPIAELGP